MSTPDQKYAELKQKLEADGMRQLKELQQKKGLILPEKDLMDLMKKGANEFKAETGRNMTYGEMREMYGWLYAHLQ